MGIPILRNTWSNESFSFVLASEQYISHSFLLSDFLIIRQVRLRAGEIDDPPLFQWGKTVTHTFQQSAVSA